MYNDPHDSICIVIRSCDFIAIRCSKYIAHHTSMSAAEGQEFLSVMEIQVLKTNEFPI
jgi:hypothetical protein